MRAVIVNEPGPAEVMQVATLPEPEPGTGEISIDVAYAGVGFVDTLFRSGAFDLGLPFTPGIEVAGRVRAVGPGVIDLQAGQPVAALLNDFGRGARAGGYAEVAVARADLSVVLDEDSDLATAAAVLANGTTAWLALVEMARVQAGDNVLVLGASGGLGGITAGIARSLGVGRVIGVVGSEARRSAAVGAGCTDTLLAGELPEAVGELTGGAGVDVAVDTVGGRLRRAAFDQLAELGRLVVVGNVSGEDVPLSGDTLWHGTKAALGLSLGGIAHLMPEQVATAAMSVLEQVRTGATVPSPASILPLDEAPVAHRALETRSAPAKIVLAT